MLNCHHGCHHGPPTPHLNVLWMKQTPRDGNCSPNYSLSDRWGVCGRQIAGQSNQMNPPAVLAMETQQGDEREKEREQMFAFPRENKLHTKWNVTILCYFIYKRIMLCIYMRSIYSCLTINEHPLEIHITLVHIHCGLCILSVKLHLMTSLWNKTEQIGGSGSYTFMIAKGVISGMSIAILSPKHEKNKKQNSEKGHFQKQEYISTLQ